MLTQWLCWPVILRMAMNVLNESSSQALVRSGSDNNGAEGHRTGPYLSTMNISIISVTAIPCAEVSLEGYPWPVTGGHTRYQKSDRNCTRPDCPMG